MFFISVLAAICSTSASIPQLMGRTDHLSFFTMIIRCTGALLWAIYGILVEEYALVFSSVIASIVEICLIVKTRYKQRGQPKPNDSAHSPTDAQSNGSSPAVREEQA